MHFVYCIENSKNDTLYIGKGCDSYNRWLEHQRIAQNPTKYLAKQQVIHDAMRKYGIENFHYYIVQYYDTKQEAFIEEYELIRYLRQQGIRLYNIADGGKGGNGINKNTPTPKCIREQQSITHKNNYILHTHSEEAKNKIRKSRANQDMSYRIPRPTKNKIRQLFDESIMTKQQLATLFNIPIATIKTILKRKDTDDPNKIPDELKLQIKILREQNRSYDDICMLLHITKKKLGYIITLYFPNLSYRTTNSNSKKLEQQVIDLYKTKQYTKQEVADKLGLTFLAVKHILAKTKTTLK